MGKALAELLLMIVAAAAVIGLFMLLMLYGPTLV
jgi:hypothetical protein